ncbi:MAG: hypothetical protein U5J82_15945 [Desulfobacterales bacterium]|nr:hypothetical protein [Desulfobacterales bacterium]
MAMDDPGSDTANAAIRPACDPLKPQFRLSALSGQEIGSRSRVVLPGCSRQIETFEHIMHSFPIEIITI